MGSAWKRAHSRFQQRYILCIAMVAVAAGIAGRAVDGVLAIREELVPVVSELLIGVIRVLAHHMDGPLPPAFCAALEGVQVDCVVTHCISLD